MRARLLIASMALGLAACGLDVELPDRPDAGQVPMGTEEDPRCPNNIVPSSDCSIERLDCPSGREGVRCTCRSDEWYCRPA